MVARSWRLLVLCFATICIGISSGGGSISEEADQTSSLPLLRGRENEHRHNATLETLLNNSESILLQEPISSTEQKWERRKLFSGARIVGGKNTPPGRYKLQVACYTSEGSFGCGASLIAPNVALSAAHCYRACETVKVNIHNRRDTSARQYKVLKKVRHPTYGRGFPNNRFDIMLMKIDDHIPLTPMMLLDDESHLMAGRKVTVTGWGATREGGSTSEILKEVELKYIDNSRCREDYGNRITKDMLCAHVNGGGKDACQGDSGGPLMIIGTDYKTDVQIGVVSWGYGCAREEYAGVYCRITEAIGWIKSTMQKELKVSASELRLFSKDGNGDTDVSSTSTTEFPTSSTSTTTPQDGDYFDVEVLGEEDSGSGSGSGEKNPIPLTECLRTFKDAVWSWTPKCENQNSFLGSLGNTRDCEWVKLNTAIRCRKDRARYCCPVTCGACDDYVPYA